MLERVIGVFKLDVATFEEIEHDRDATMQAAIVVLIVALVVGLGNGIGEAIGEGTFISGLLGGIITTFFGWILWSAITYFVGTSFFEGQADLGEMLRVIGFAYVPQILGIIPCFGQVVGAIWTLVAGFIAVRQGLDLDNTKTFLTLVVGFIGYVALVVIYSIVVGIGGFFFGLFGF